LTAAAGVLALLAAGAGLALAVSAGAAPLGALDDTTEPVPTQPAPDPAPTPAPKQTAKPKPAPKRTTPAPKRTYSAPTSTYTPPRTAPTPKSTVVRKPKRQHKKATKPAVTTTVPTETARLPSVLIPVPLGARSTPTRADGEGMVTSVLFIGGVSFAALLFLLAATVPGTPARFTPVGRVVIEHQQDFVVVGVAAFVITVFVYILTGHGL
jgi:hypothetical protein